MKQGLARGRWRRPPPPGAPCPRHRRWGAACCQPLARSLRAALAAATRGARAAAPPRSLALYIVARGSASDECAAFHMTETRQEGGGESSVTLRTCKGGYLSVVVIPIHTFHMYRAQGGDDYPLANVNTANLGGVLWYLHNEVVKDSPRKFGITRIKVSTTSPDKLASRGMNFGVRFAYDSQKCTSAGPWNGPGSCDRYYQEYGNFVGCNLLGKYPFPIASQGFPVHYGGAKWYSLPKKGACKCEEGKACAPTGAVDCMHTAEWAGDIYLQDLEGIGNYDGFVGSGQKEYDQGQDAGTPSGIRNSTIICAGSGFRPQTPSSSERIQNALETGRCPNPTATLAALTSTAASPTAPQTTATRRCRNRRRHTSIRSSADESCALASLGRVHFFLGVDLQGAWAPRGRPVQVHAPSFVACAVETPAPAGIDPDRGCPARAREAVRRPTWSADPHWGG
ncbi:unnamed protein product [Prorocentrum cordatum]|uniref:Cellulase n=1 Tax=Prorocentrum cordatum TaxID=2364126 RepID=A0ABN9WC96_9DINO|nr:unnamed protein product [Polarella glacialis]